MGGGRYFLWVWACILGFVVLFWQHKHSNTQDVVGGVTLSPPAGGKDPPKNDPKPSKPNYIQRENINVTKGIPRASSSGDQRDCPTESHSSTKIEVHTTESENQNRSI